MDNRKAKSQVQAFAHKVFLTLLMKRPVQKMLLPLGRELQPERWIFVIGCYNSATTLLAKLLRQHPGIGGLPNEGAFLTDALPYPETYGWPRMWSQCIDEVRLLPGPGESARARRIRRQWSLWFPGDTPYLVEKSISNAARLLFLQEYFQPAYFIYIVRNGYVVAKGIQQKANYSRWNCSHRESGYPIELCAEQWRKSDEVVTADSGKLKNFLPLTYEELTADPAGLFRRITDFLGIEPMDSTVFEDTMSVHGTVSRITNMNHVGLGRLAPEDFEKIQSVAADTLKKYGYDSTGDDHNSGP